MIEFMVYFVFTFGSPTVDIEVDIKINTPQHEDTLPYQTEE
jgi:hypothetical protein